MGDDKPIKLEELAMNDIALLAAMDSLHQLIEKFVASPPLSSLLWISSISGIIGVVIGFVLQEIKNIIIKKSNSKKEMLLIEFELKQIMSNCNTAIETGVYLLNNHPAIDRAMISVPTPSPNVFYTAFIANSAALWTESKLLSIASSYEYISELDKVISYLEDISSSNVDRLLYNYEYVVSMAVRAYNHAENGLKKEAGNYKSVSIDHAETSKKLGFNCDYLFSKNRIKRS